MSTQPDRQHEKQQDAMPVAVEPFPADSLPPDVARRTEEEALQRALTVSEEVIESRRRGRIEAETRRISEEVTRQAQARLQTSRMMSAPPHTDMPGAPPDGAVSSIYGENATNAVLQSQQQAAPPAPKAINQILVPLDGTPYSERVLPYVAPLAHMTGATITLLHVIPDSTAPHVLDAVSRAADRLLSEAPVAPLSDPTGYLQAIQAQLAQYGVEAESMCRAAPSPVEGIELVMEHLHADLVMLATHARQGIEQRLLGSVGDGLVQRGRAPVLLIPPHVARLSDSGGPLPTFRRVLVPLDGSQVAEQALEPVIGLAQQAAAREHGLMHIVLLHVAESYHTRPDGVRYGEAVRERLLAQGLPASVEVTAAAVVGSPSGAIVGAARYGLINLPEYPAPFDLVAMATHGRGGLQRWLYGSVAAYVLPRITIPTILVHRPV